MIKGLEYLVRMALENSRRASLTTTAGVVFFGLEHCRDRRWDVAGHVSCQLEALGPPETLRRGSCHAAWERSCQGPLRERSEHTRHGVRQVGLCSVRKHTRRVKTRSPRQIVVFSQHDASGDAHNGAGRSAVAQLIFDLSASSTRLDEAFVAAAPEDELSCFAEGRRNSLKSV